MALAHLVVTLGARPCDAASGGFRWSCLIHGHGRRAAEASKRVVADALKANRGLLGGAGYRRAAGAQLVVYNRDIPVVTAETLARLAAACRSVIPPDLEGGRFGIIKDLVLDRDPREATFASRSVLRSRLSSRFQDSDIGDSVVSAIVPVEDDFLDVHISALGRELHPFDVLLPPIPFAVNVDAWIDGLDRLLAEHDPLFSSSGGAHEDDGRDYDRGQSEDLLHFLFPSDPRSGQGSLSAYRTTYLGRARTANTREILIIREVAELLKINTKTAYKPNSAALAFTSSS